MSKKYLIIGASAAGLSAAHKLRQLDPQSSITCFTQEKELSYNKCLLADYLASELEYPSFKTEKFFEDNCITVKTECTIAKINPQERIIYDAHLNSYTYDALLVAVGGDIVRPEKATSLCENVFDFYTYSQTKFIKEYAQRDATSTIVIIGAGLSGLECADALKRLGKKIIIIEKSERVLAHQITPQASSFIQDKIKNAGVEIVTDAVVQDFVIHDDMVKEIALSNGKTVLVDMVVYALGARANTALVIDAGLQYENGALIVNEFLQTSDSFIWAAGDICRVYNTLTESFIKSCTWPDAMQQGMYAAHSMVGIAKVYKGAAPVISSHFFGMKFFVAGRIYVQDDDVLTITSSENKYNAIITRNNIVQGFIIFGDNALFFGLKHSLLTQTPYTS